MLKGLVGRGLEVKRAMISRVWMMAAGVCVPDSSGGGATRSWCVGHWHMHPQVRAYIGMRSKMLPSVSSTVVHIHPMTVGKEPRLVWASSSWT